MRRLLVILVLFAMPIQAWDLRPLEDRDSPSSRTDLTIDALPASPSAGLALRRTSPLEQFLTRDAGLVVLRNFDSVTTGWCSASEQALSGATGSNDTLQAQHVRWQI